MTSLARKQAQPEQDKKAGLLRAVVGGRFMTAYNPEQALEIVERLAEGETLVSICKGKAGMPHPTTFKRWVVNNPDLAKAYTQAIVVSATSLEEEALDTARLIALLPKDGTHVRAAEVKLNQLRWSAERRDATKFGTKSQINIKVPVQIITSMDLGDPGGGPASQDIYTLNAKDITPIVAEELPTPLPHTHGPTGPRKRVLTPRNPNYEFKKPLRPISHQPSRKESGGDEGVGQSNRDPNLQEAQGNPFTDHPLSGEESK